jgi:hypothetical protein
MRRSLEAANAEDYYLKSHHPRPRLLQHIPVFVSFRSLNAGKTNAREEHAFSVLTVLQMIGYRQIWTIKN